MAEAAFPEILRFCLGFFWPALAAVHVVVFRDLRRRGRDRHLLESLSVRDHVVRALARGAATGGVLALAGFALRAIRGPSLGGVSGLVFGETLLAFSLLAVGFAAVAVRFSLRIVERRGMAAVPLMRIAFLVLGAGYGMAMWFLLPDKPMDTLIAVLVLAGALCVLGLNGMTAVSAETLERLARGNGWRDFPRGNRRGSPS